MQHLHNNHLGMDMLVKEFSLHNILHHYLPILYRSYICSHEVDRFLLQYHSLHHHNDILADLFCFQHICHNYQQWKNKLHIRFHNQNSWDHQFHYHLIHLGIHNNLLFLILNIFTNGSGRTSRIRIIT